MEHARAVAEILNQRFQPAQTPSLATDFLQASGVAESALRGISRVFGRCARFEVFLRLHLEMKPHLLVQLAIKAIPAQKKEKSLPDGIKHLGFLIWSAHACLRLIPRQLAAAPAKCRNFSCGDKSPHLPSGPGRSKLRQTKAVASYRTPSVIHSAVRPADRRGTLFLPGGSPPAQQPRPSAMPRRLLCSDRSA